MTLFLLAVSQLICWPSPANVLSAGICLVLLFATLLDKLAHRIVKGS